MLANLWTGAEITPEQIELEWIRLYHCVPSALDGENVRTLMAHLTILAAEAEVRRVRSRKNERPGR